MQAVLNSYEKRYNVSFSVDPLPDIDNVVDPKAIKDYVSENEEILKGKISNVFFSQDDKEFICNILKNLKKENETFNKDWNSLVEWCKTNMTKKLKDITITENMSSQIDKLNKQIDDLNKDIKLEKLDSKNCDLKLCLKIKKEFEDTIKEILDERQKLEKIIEKINRNIHMTNADLQSEIEEIKDEYEKIEKEKKKEKI